MNMNREYVKRKQIAHKRIHIQGEKDLVRIFWF